MKGSNVLRWIAMPFGAVIASLLIFVIAKFGFYWGLDYAFGTFFLGFESLTYIAKIISETIATFASCSAFIYFAKAIAPSHRKNVGIIFATISVILMVISWIINLKTSTNGIIEQSIYTISGSIASIVSAIDNQLIDE